MYESSVSVKKEVLLHLIFWLVWSYYSFVTLDNNGLHIAKNVGLFYITGIIVSIATFYCNYFFVLPKVFKPFKWRKAFLGYFIILALYVSLRYLTEEVLTVYLYKVRNYTADTNPVYYFYDNIFYSSRPIILSTVLWTIIFLIRTLDYNNYVTREQKNMEIKFLKAQINPHFIFNTLNNIYAMVNAQSPQSLPAIEKLSHIMRFTTYEAQRNLVKLSEELGYIQAYIELEELRHYEKSFIKWNMDIKDKTVEIPPYMLSPLVENALKHGTFSQANPIEITLICNEKYLHFEVINEIGKQKKDKLGGIGSENLKNRLEILYPGQHEFKTTDKDNIFAASLKIYWK